MAINSEPAVPQVLLVNESLKMGKVRQHSGTLLAFICCHPFCRVKVPSTKAIHVTHLLCRGRWQRNVRMQRWAL
jgi:hypothetical protein